jgi:hypothetical protein
MEKIGENMWEVKDCKTLMENTGLICILICLNLSTSIIICIYVTVLQRCLL